MKKNILGLFLPLSFLVLVTLGAILAPYLAPYGPNDSDRTASYHPPVKVHFLNKHGLITRPYVYKSTTSFNEFYERVYEEDKSVAYQVKFFQGKLFSVDQPARIYLFGADSRGRDLYTRMLYGARISLLIGFLGAGIASLVGWFLGGISGYFGGKTDAVLMRVAEFFIMIPGFYFLLALRAALPPELGSKYVFFLIVIILSLIGWGGMGRVIRGQVLSIREHEFVLSARLLGRGHLEILFKHIFPHTFAYFAVILSISIPSYILMESGLSVLGLGIQEPEISWGSLLSEAMSIAHIQMHPWILWPGAVIFLVAVSFNVLGDSLRESAEIL